MSCSPGSNEISGLPPHPSPWDEETWALAYLPEPPGEDLDPGPSDEDDQWLTQAMLTAARVARKAGPELDGQASIYDVLG